MVDRDRAQIEELTAEYSKRFIEKANKPDSLATVTLTGHLVIEEAITEIIETHLFHPEQLEKVNLTFAHKVAIVRSLSLSEHNNAMWDLVLALNALRNDFAHSIDSEKREKRMALVLQIYRREMNPEELAREEQQQREERWPDYIWITYATTFCLGFLGAFLAESKRFRDFVDAGDRMMNPHRFTQK